MFQNNNKTQPMSRQGLRIFGVHSQKLPGSYQLTRTVYSHSTYCLTIQNLRTYHGYLLTLAWVSFSFIVQKDAFCFEFPEITFKNPQNSVVDPVEQFQYSSYLYSLHIVLCSCNTYVAVIQSAESLINFCQNQAHRP